MSEQRLFAWVIFDRPSDYPGGFIARRFILDRGPDPVPTEDVIKGATLEAVRRGINQVFPPLICFTRNEQDHPTVVESWI